MLARGPGETKLETDRRRILARNSKLERELKETVKHRETQRKARKKSDIPQISIVGYTNAGKSTLLNALTDADVLVEDRLFATLDSTVRRLELPDQHKVLIADTVGFVRRLPHHLVEAFRSTLSEVAEADLLLHVVDGTDPDPAGQIAAVREVLMEIGAAEIPELIAINKADMIGEFGTDSPQQPLSGCSVHLRSQGDGARGVAGEDRLIPGANDGFPHPRDPLRPR